MREHLAAFCALLLLVPSSVGAQHPVPVSFVMAGGGLLYEGARDISGAGWHLRAALAVRPGHASRWRGRLEYGFHRLDVMGQSCTTGVPASCFPESPPERLHSGA